MHDITQSPTHGWHNITHSPTRGWLTCVTPTGNTRTESGWFTLSADGSTVTRRKIGGRNIYMYCAVHRVLEFTADETAK